MGTLFRFIQEQIHNHILKVFITNVILLAYSVIITITLYVVYPDSDIPDMTVVNESTAKLKEELENCYNAGYEKLLTKLKK